MSNGRYTSPDCIVLCRQRRDFYYLIYGPTNQCTFLCCASNSYMHLKHEMLDFMTKSISGGLKKRFKENESKNTNDHNNLLTSSSLLSLAMDRLIMRNELNRKYEQAFWCVAYLWACIHSEYCYMSRIDDFIQIILDILHGDGQH